MKNLYDNPHLNFGGGAGFGKEVIYTPLQITKKIESMEERIIAQQEILDELIKIMKS